MADTRLFESNNRQKLPAKAGFGLGQLLRRLKPVADEHRLFIFTPPAFSEEGLAIIRTLLEQYQRLNPVVVSGSEKILELLKQWASVNALTFRSYHATHRNRITGAFHLGFIKEWISLQSGPILIGFGSKLFYDLTALQTQYRNPTNIEVLLSTASFNPGLPYTTQIHHRVFPTNRLKKDMVDFYRHHALKEDLLERLAYIETAIKIKNFEPKPADDTLEIVLMANEHDPKRLRLVPAIIQKMRHQRVRVHFTVLGLADEGIQSALAGLCSVFGADDDQTGAIENADVYLTLPASTESSMILKNMMAMGKAIVATAVDFAPDYIQDGVNGLLLPDDVATNKVVDDCVIALSILAADRFTLLDMQQANRRLAQDKFDPGKIAAAWDKMIAARS